MPVSEAGLTSRGGAFSTRKACRTRASSLMPARTSHLNRDQRHLLPHPDTGDISQMGFRSAGRLRVFGEGTALRRKPARAVGAGDSIKRFLQSGVRPSWGRGLAPCSGNITPYKKFDEKDFGGFLELLRRHSTAKAAPRGRGP